MKYVGRTKVGRLQSNPKTILAIVRLPVELNEYIGKYAHIWKVDDNTITIKFSDNKVMEESPSVHYTDLEERVKRLEEQIKLIAKLAERPEGCETTEGLGAGKTGSRRRDLNPRPGDYKSPALAS